MPNQRLSSRPSVSRASALSAFPIPIALPGLAPLAAAALCLALPGLLAVRPAHAGDLAAFLERAEKMTTVNEKVEADITIRDPDGSERKAHVAIDPADGGSVVFEEPATGFRAETPLAWKDGKAVTKTGASPEKFGTDDTYPGTDLRPLDFFPFWKTDYSRALTSDENTLEQTVSLYADKGRPYSLYVVTFDKTRLVPRMVKFYRDTFNNLVRIRTDKDWVMVGSRPRPGAVLIKDFAGNSLRTYAFSWRLAGAATAVPAAPEDSTK
jgi:hypothetical protein